MKILSEADVEQLSAKAAASPRLRANENMHPELDDPIQRFMNAMEPGTYVRPHRHRDGRWELFLLMSGAAAILTFDDDGRVIDKIEMSIQGGAVAIEIPQSTWHTVLCRETSTVLFEVKPGPYIQLTDKDFAHWAPEEGSPDCSRFEQWFRDACSGSLPPNVLDTT